MDGIEPERDGFEVNDRVWSEGGREFGGELKLLFDKYLLDSQHMISRVEQSGL